MKKILITGANSFIGVSFENYIKNFQGYQIDTVDMIDGSWRDKDFSSYDTVFHVAGIAHSDTGNASEEIIAKYYKINTDLTIETATKAKNDGVKQFVFMSSMIVFGSKNGCVTKDTEPNPDNFYGNSKLQADIGIHKLQDQDFNVVSLRPPMIYGKESKGNFPKLVKLAKITPVFPYVENKRSMLYIENLCEFIKLVIDNNEKGYFYPQNEDYINTSKLISDIGFTMNKKIFLIKGFGWFFRFVSKRIMFVNKIFGDLYYDKSMSLYKTDYIRFTNKESIERSIIHE